jgi:hypothetical protein
MEHRTSITNLRCLVYSQGLLSTLSQHPTETVPTVHLWFSPLISRLVYSIPGIRSKALDTLIAVTPKLIEKEDPRRQQAVAKFLSDQCADFFSTLTQNFLNNGEGTRNGLLLGNDHQERGFSLTYLFMALSRSLRNNCLGSNGHCHRTAATTDCAFQSAPENGRSKRRPPCVFIMKAH